MALNNDSDEICDCFPSGRLAISSEAWNCVAAEWGVAENEMKWRRLGCARPFYTFGCP